jgi:hypothetical protein
MVRSLEAAAHSDEVAPAPPKPSAPSVPLRSLKLWLMLLVAGALTGIAIGVIAGRQAGRGPSMLQTVARAELDHPTSYLERTIPAHAIEEARQCKIPIPYVTLQAEADKTPDRIRIRSGSYISPWLLLNGTPQRVAVPFPAPYPTGNGELFIEGVTRPVTIWLSPAIVVGTQVASNPVPVTWNTSNPCPP